MFSCDTAMAVLDATTQEVTLTKPGGLIAELNRRCPYVPADDGPEPRRRDHRGRVRALLPQPPVHQRVHDGEEGATPVFPRI